MDRSIDSAVAAALARPAATARLARGEGYHDRRRALLADLLLDGADAELLERPCESLSMLTVASLAGVHRSLLYKEFGSRRALLRALVAREAGRLQEQLAHTLASNAGAPTLALQLTFECFLDATRESGVLAALLRRGEDEVSSLASAHRTATLGRLVQAISGAWPALAREESRQLADWLLRFAFSVSRVPANRWTAGRVGELLGCWVEARLAA